MGVMVAQRVTQGGLAVWATGGLALSTLPASQDRPVAASDGAGGAIFAWHDLRNALATSNDIYAQHVSADGLLLWPAGGLPVCTDRAAQIYPTICSDGSGGAIVAWQDSRGGGDIYAQRLDGAGNAIWQPDGIPVCTAAGEQDLPQIVAAGAGQGIVAWTDPRNGNTDIYAQRIPYDGVVPVQVSLVSAEALDGMARIEWRHLGSSGVLFDIERRTHDSEWTTVEGAYVDGEGKIVHEERGVIAGTEYGWRLQPRDSNGPIGEVWLAIRPARLWLWKRPVP
jgi:hypothetical protein